MYTYKIYDKSDTFKKTINIDLIENEVNFTTQINGGLGNLQISIIENIDTTSYIKGDIIKIFLWIDIIYSWFIDEVRKNATNHQSITLSCVGYASRLTNIHYNSSGYTGIFTWDPSALFESSIDYFNTFHNVLTKDSDTLGTSISYDYDYTSCYDIANDMKELWENYYWYINANWVAKYKQIPTRTTNIFTFKKDIFSLQVEQTEVVNKLFLEYSWGTVVYEDTTSQNTYWVFEKRLSRGDLNDLTSANLFWNAYIEENKNPKDRAIVGISNEYVYSSYTLMQDLTQNWNTYTQNMEDLRDIKGIANIEPWELCTIRNINIELENLLVTRKLYTPEQITLYLDSYDSFIELIKQ